MKRTLFACLILTLAACSVFAQNEKPWSEWTKKNAEKILNDSSWGQTFTVGGTETTSTSAITSTASNGNANREINRSGESGAPKASSAMNYRVRFLTAKPIREAFSRMVLLSAEKPSPELPTQLQGFVDRDFGNYLVVVVSIDSENARAAAGALMGFGKLTLDSLKDKAYLERKDGKRLALTDYKAPIGDNLGAKFIFERTVDGQPFLNEASDSVRFVLDFSDKLKLNMKFKVASMVYAGKLEY